MAWADVRLEQCNAVFLEGFDRKHNTKTIYKIIEDRDIKDINNMNIINDSNITRKGTTKSHGQKHELDKFYTVPDIAQQCLSYINLHDYDMIIEPSAGGGSFSNLIEGCLAFDIYPEKENITQADWLALDKSIFTGKKCLVIGNPPFGNNGSLALKFIKESATFAHTIAFVLPKGFKKESVKNRVPTTFHLQNEIDLPPYSFTLLEEKYHVPCIFQIWERRSTNRTINKNKTTSEIIEFVSAEKAHFRVQRVGGNAGKAFTNLDVSDNSNYFIYNKSNYSNGELIKIINNLIYPTINDTTGPRSLSKGELINTLDNYIYNDKI